MDLYAYSQIDTLEEIMKNNNINVPRLRGLLLMKDEVPFSREDFEKMCKNAELNTVKRLCRARPYWSRKPYVHSYNLWTDYLVSYYISDNKRGDEDGHVRWDRIHGWKRRVAKFEIKKKKRRIREQLEMFNKYAGRDDVLYIHARIGGNNWKYYDGDNTIAKEPWFLGKVDDRWDSTYCDIYAKIDPSSLVLLKEKRQ